MSSPYFFVLVSTDVLTDELDVTLLDKDGVDVAGGLMDKGRALTFFLGDVVGAVASTNHDHPLRHGWFGMVSVGYRRHRSEGESQDVSQHSTHFCIPFPVRCRVVCRPQTELLFWDVRHGTRRSGSGRAILVS